MKCISNCMYPPALSCSRIYQGNVLITKNWEEDCAPLRVIIKLSLPMNVFVTNSEVALPFNRLTEEGHIMIVICNWQVH